MVVVPEMAAQYIPRSSLRALVRQYRRYGYYRAKTSRAHPDSMRATHLVPPAIVLLLTAAARSGRAPRRHRRASAPPPTEQPIAAATGAAARSNGPAAAVRLPAVFAAMHLAWGTGFLAGCVRWGPPLTRAARGSRARQKRRRL